MSSGIFHRLGGPDVVGAVVEEFHQRVRNDQELQEFFEGSRICFLKLHQFYILRAVFEGITPEVSEMIISRHKRLFSAQSLDMGHYYRLFDHLIDAMYAIDLRYEMIDEVLESAIDLRRVFVQGVNQHGVGEDCDQNICCTAVLVTSNNISAHEQDLVIKNPSDITIDVNELPGRRSSKINRMMAFFRSPSFMSLSCRSLKVSAI